MSLKILSLVILGLIFPSLFFASYLLPSGFFEPGLSRNLYDLTIFFIAPGLGGLLAGWQWRWKGGLLTILYLVSCIVTANIEHFREGPAPEGVISEDLGFAFVYIVGFVGTGVVLFTSLSSAGITTISNWIKRRHNR
jgi:hypothetical protein